MYIMKKYTAPIVFFKEVVGTIRPGAVWLLIVVVVTLRFILMTLDFRLAKSF